MHQWLILSFCMPCAVLLLWCLCMQHPPCCTAGMTATYAVLHISQLVSQGTHPNLHAVFCCLAWLAGMVTVSLLAPGWIAAQASTPLWKAWRACCASTLWLHALTHFIQFNIRPDYIHLCMLHGLALCISPVQGVEGLLYLSSFGYYQIKASSAEALNDIITAISQLGGEARCRAERAASTKQPWLCEERSSCWF